MTYIIDTWKRCYNKGWSGVLTPDSFKHPAKVAFGLAERIYQHVRDEGWARPGDTIVDPFGGIGGFAFHAMHAGLNVVLVELEQKFVDLAQANIDEWHQRYGHLSGFGRAVIIQGDSRRLGDVLAEASLSLSSPPYSSDTVNTRNGIDQEKLRAKHRVGKTSQAVTMDGYGDTEGNLGNLPAPESGFQAAISSPPYNLPMSQDHNGSRGGDRGTTPSEPGAFVKYGNTPGQLEGMKGDEASFNLAISSPPYVESLSSDDPEKRGGLFRDPKRSNDKTLTATYGESDGQLGAMKEGIFDVAISSPPYSDMPVADLPRGKQDGAAGGIGKNYREGNRPTNVRKKPDGTLTESYGQSEGQLGQMRESKDGFEISVSSPPYEASASNCTNNHGGKVDASWKAGGIAARDPRLAQGYGESEGNIGNQAGQDFWSAARLILKQTHSILAPGAHAIWVLKAFVRKGQVVNFPDQWRQLSEAVGFETIHWHNASLVEHNATQARMDGGEDHIRRERKSFFRRLAEQKGSPRIDAEVVLCTRKK